MLNLVVAFSILLARERLCVVVILVATMMNRILFAVDGIALSLFQLVVQLAMSI